MADCEHRAMFCHAAEGLARQSGYPTLLWEVFEDLLPYALGPASRTAGCGWRLLGEVAALLEQRPAGVPLLRDFEAWLQSCGVGRQRTEETVRRLSRQEPNLLRLAERFRPVVDRYRDQSEATRFFDGVHDCPFPEPCPRPREPSVTAAWYWCRLYLLALDDDALGRECDEW